MAAHVDKKAKISGDSSAAAALAADGKLGEDFVVLQQLTELKTAEEAELAPLLKAQFAESQKMKTRHAPLLLAYLGAPSAGEAK